MHTPLIRPDFVLSSEGPFLAVGELTQREARATPPHGHARGQLMRALSGLVSIGVNRQQWVVPAIHAIWIALELGHENVSAFVDMFRRATGTTPGRYAAAGDHSG